MSLTTTALRRNRRLLERIAESRKDRGRDDKPVERVRTTSLAIRQQPGNLKGSPAKLARVYTTGTTSGWSLFPSLQSYQNVGEGFSTPKAKTLKWVSGHIIGQKSWSLEALAEYRDGIQDDVEDEGNEA